MAKGNGRRNLGERLSLRRIKQRICRLIDMRL